jgi:glycosyltransferase involved in cell wall biosynthesis
VIVTVGIKVLNEEKQIAAALESALRAVKPFRGEVILADSVSTDRTIEIARRFPVRIVQLLNPSERCCGASAQLAFQHALGTYFYLLDGDMVLDADFLHAGIAYLEANPEVVAVGGYIVERNLKAHGFQIQADVARTDRNRRPGLVDRLEGGGLYRSSAVQEAGYFADRNLHAFEEFELASRLQCRGWKLARIDHVAAEHFGHNMGGYRLLWRRIRTGYVGATGEVVRGAFGQRHLPVVLSRFRHAQYGVVVICWWALLACCSWLSPALLCIALAAPIAFLWARRGSLRLGLYSMTSWNVNALGLITGLVRRRVPPDKPLASVTLSSGD